MRILVLGSSDSLGSHLPDPSVAWTASLCGRLAPLGVEVELVNRVFSPEGAPALAYLTKCLSEHQPEMVIAKPGIYAFAALNVRYTVERRFGRRVGGAFFRSERLLRSVERRAGRAGETLQRGIQEVTRRLVPAGSLMSEELATDTWLAAFDRLAREEQLDVIVMAPWAYSSHFMRAYPKSEGILGRFHDALEGRARQHHFRWLELEPALRDAAGSWDECFSDDWVHTNELGHRLTLEHLVAAMLDRPAPA